MERQRNESLKAASSVLQLAQADHMINAVSRVFDMAIEHGSVRAQTQLMGLAVNANPGIGVGLVLTDFVADFGMKNLRAPAGQTAEPGVFEFGENVACRPAC